VEVATTALNLILRNRNPGTLESSLFPLLLLWPALWPSYPSCMAFKGHKRYVHRLILYLMVAALLEAVVSILAVIPYMYCNPNNGSAMDVGEGFEDFCATSGFLLELTVWIPRLVICWIVLYLGCF